MGRWGGYDVWKNIELQQAKLGILNSRLYGDFRTTVVYNT